MSWIRSWSLVTGLWVLVAGAWLLVAGINRYKAEGIRFKVK
jgi:hypothetical protein